MEHVHQIQISAVLRDSVDGTDAYLRVSTPLSEAREILVGSGFPDHLTAVAAVIEHAMTRLRRDAVAGVDYPAGGMPAASVR